MIGRVVTAGLAVAFALVVAACDDGVRPPTAEVAADTADQVIYGLVHVLTDDGVLRARLEADTAYYYEKSQVAEMTGVKVTFYSTQGAISSVLTAREGTYRWRTGNMEARQNVVAVTPDGRRLTTSILEYRRSDNQINGSAPFVFDSPDRHLEGAAFTSDPDFRNVVTRGAHRGTIGTVSPDRR